MGFFQNIKEEWQRKKTLREVGKNEERKAFENAYIKHRAEIGSLKAEHEVNILKTKQQKEIDRIKSQDKYQNPLNRISKMLPPPRRMLPPPRRPNYNPPRRPNDKGKFNMLYGW
jgi:hypothetical protein